MGNDHSKSKQMAEVKSQSEKSEEPSNTLNDSYFSRISDGKDAISAEKLSSLFDEDLAESLLRYFTGSVDSKFVTRRQFSEKFTALYGTSMDIYVKILQPVHHFIKVCSDSAGAPAIHGDEQFIKTLVENMTSGKTGDEATQSVISWRRENCEKFTQAVQNRVMAVCTGNRKPDTVDYSSDILTPLQMWYLQSALPNVYFPAKSSDATGDNHWTPLYSSLQHGISTNRFETLVFDYRGPTVAIFRLKDGRVTVIATDQEWRHSGTRFGGNFTSFFEISPNIRRVDKPNSIYCNLKFRSAAYGLNFKNELEIGKDLDELLDIEVWGCAGAGTLTEQQKLKTWQKQQAEKHKKVPLPGNWDDNPDKALLEMAGFQFSNERSVMETEKRKEEIEVPTESETTSSER